MTGQSLAGDRFSPLSVIVSSFPSEADLERDGVTESTTPKLAISPPLMPIARTVMIVETLKGQPTEILDLENTMSGLETSRRLVSVSPTEQTHQVLVRATAKTDPTRSASMLLGKLDPPRPATCAATMRNCFHHEKKASVAISQSRKRWPRHQCL